MIRFEGCAIMRIWSATKSVPPGLEEGGEDAGDGVYVRAPGKSRTK